MSLDPYLQALLIRSQIAEAQRQGALRSLVRQVTLSRSPSRAPRRMHRLVRAVPLGMRLIATAAR